MDAPLLCGHDHSIAAFRSSNVQNGEEFRMFFKRSYSSMKGKVKDKGMVQLKDILRRLKNNFMNFEVWFVP